MEIEKFEFLLFGVVKPQVFSVSGVINPLSSLDKEVSASLGCSFFVFFILLLSNVFLLFVVLGLPIFAILVGIFLCISFGVLLAILFLRHLLRHPQVEELDDLQLPLQVPAHLLLLLERLLLLVVQVLLAHGVRNGRDLVLQSLLDDVPRLLLQHVLQVGLLLRHVVAPDEMLDRERLLTVALELVPPVDLSVGILIIILFLIMFPIIFSNSVRLVHLVF